MSAFAASWLALREPADRQARDAGLAQRFAAALPPQPTILDLGAGTGASARALSAFLDDPHPPSAGALGPPSPAMRERGPSTARRVRERWVLLESDAELLALQPDMMRGLRFESVARDLAEGLGDLAADGVTTAALLDLAGAEWLEQLAGWLAQRGVPFLAVLTVDGKRDYWPADPEDEAVAAAFARDQGRDKGLGPALGPAASGILAASLARRGFSVSTAASDWRLGTDRPELLTMLVRGEAEAAGAPGWGGRRLAQIAEERLRARIGHRDLLALPPPK